LRPHEPYHMINIVVMMMRIESAFTMQIFMDNDEIPGEKKIYSIFYNEKCEHLITGNDSLVILT